MPGENRVPGHDDLFIWKLYVLIMKTIRSRLIIMFAVCLSFTGELTLIYYQNVFALEKKLLLLEKFDDFKDNILELRRYEKNLFFTGKSGHTEQMDHYLSKTESSFVELGSQIRMLMGKIEYEDFATALKSYREALNGFEKPCNWSGRPVN